MVGFAIRHSRMLAAIEGKVQGIVNVKMADDALSLLILSIFCGMLMFTAVDAFRNEKLPSVCRPVMVFLCVMVFILSGFEHSIADIFYFAASGMVSGEAFLYLIMIIIGNSIGGLIIPLLQMVKPAPPQE